MSDWATKVCDRIATTMHHYWQERYRAYLEETDMDAKPTPLAAMTAMTPKTATRPDAVQDAYQYYRDHVAARDRGTVNLETLSLEDKLVYAIRAATDGDDGWLELYDASGSLLRAGRTYIELVAWGDRDEIRSEVHTGDYPATLNRNQTLWGQ
ncbi:MAG: hypothetical protein AAFY26_19475 [Cyanobacteria bacterium J06638_22]